MMLWKPPPGRTYDDYAGCVEQAKLLAVTLAACGRSVVDDEFLMRLRVYEGTVLGGSSLLAFARENPGFSINGGDETYLAWLWRMRIGFAEAAKVALPLLDVDCTPKAYITTMKVELMALAAPIWKIKPRPLRDLAERARLRDAENLFDTAMELLGRVERALPSDEEDDDE